MEIRRLLGRLFPGRNGSGELTSVEIAGAFGMIADKLARDVLWACWCRDPSEPYPLQLLDLIGVRQLKEFVKQREHFERIMLATLIETDRVVLNGDDPEKDADVTRAYSKMQRASSELWLGRNAITRRDFAMFGKIRDAVLAEVSKPNQCTTCAGRMHVIRATRMLKCKRCDGRGTVPISKRQRAALIGVDESNFRRQWQPVYEFTYAIVRDAEGLAVARMLEILEPMCRGKAFRNGAYVPPGERGKRGIDPPRRFMQS